MATEQSELARFQNFVQEAEQLEECTLEQQIDVYLKTFPGRTVSLVEELILEQNDDKQNH